MFQMALTFETLLDKYPELVNFVTSSVADFDESHDLNHAVTVTIRAHAIMASLDPSFDEQLLVFMAMLHDVRDHKYTSSITRDQLVDFVKIHLGEEKMVHVMHVIENLSWSKESQGKRERCIPGLENYLIAVGDADRLEAIGAVGIERCYAFGKAKYPNLTHEEATKRVVDHCDEKLLRIYPEHFIVSDYARKLAEPLHEEIVRFREDPSTFEFNV